MPNQSRSSKGQNGPAAKIRNQEVRVAINLDSLSAAQTKSRSEEELEALKDFFFDLALEVLKNDYRQENSDLLPCFDGNSTGTRKHRYTKKAA